MANQQPEHRCLACGCEIVGSRWDRSKYWWAHGSEDAGKWFCSYCGHQELGSCKEFAYLYKMIAMGSRKQ